MIYIVNDIILWLLYEYECCKVLLQKLSIGDLVARRRAFEHKLHSHILSNTCGRLVIEMPYS